MNFQLANFNHIAGKESIVLSFCVERDDESDVRSAVSRPDFNFGGSMKVGAFILLACNCTRHRDKVRRCTPVASLKRTRLCSGGKQRGYSRCGTPKRKSKHTRLQAVWKHQRCAPRVCAPTGIIFQDAGRNERTRGLFTPSRQAEAYFALLNIIFYFCCNIAQRKHRKLWHPSTTERTLFPTLSISAQMPSSVIRSQPRRVIV
jgi:hypothetical protein